MRSIVYTFVAVALFFVSTAIAGSGHGAHWGYEGDVGPERWGGLSHEFEKCSKGKKQSPIDIPSSAGASGHELKLSYKPSSLRVINNGHTIQVNYDEGSYITINGEKHHLLQFHFHTPSENVVDGKPYDMEAHLVHKSADGQLAVVGVFMKKGKHNPFLQTVWDNLPAKEGHEKTAAASINVLDFLPADKSYYHFEGSLTTPPCSEGVKWHVMKTHVEVSADQIATFANLFKANARPAQPLNGRKVLTGKASAL